MTGDARDEDALRRLVDGVDAVVSALGPRGRDDTLLTTVAQGLRSAMASAGVRRYVGVSVAGLDLPGDRKGSRDRAIGVVVRALARGAARDREGELLAWQTSGLDWTLVRVPRLVDGPETPDATLDAHTPPKATTLHRAALARVLVTLAADGRFVGQAPFCADA